MAVLASTQKAPVRGHDHDTYRLRFTGTCDRAEFDRRCDEHDFWYHSFYFDNGFSRRGDYDIGRDVEDYGFPADMTGMSVLDVGTGSGWFATYFEQRGASVTTVDARGYCDFDVFGRPGYPHVGTEKAAPDRVTADGRPVYYSPVSRGFWVMKDILGLKAEYVNARAYDLSPALFGGRRFDLVFMGALLMHLRDPIGALAAARSVCGHRLITNSLQPPQPEEQGRPVMELLARPVDPVSWWMPNKLCLGKWLEGAGFARYRIDRTVQATTDRPVTSNDGTTSASQQSLYLVDAYV